MNKEQFAQFQIDHANLLMKYGIDEHLSLLHVYEDKKVWLDIGQRHEGKPFFKDILQIVLRIYNPKNRPPDINTSVIPK